MDLRNSSREDLIAIILAQRDLLVRLEQVVVRQEGQVAAFEATIKRLTERLGERAAARPPRAEGVTDLPGSRPRSTPSVISVAHQVLILAIVGSSGNRDGGSARPSPWGRSVNG